MLHIALFLTFLWSETTPTQDPSIEAWIQWKDKTFQKPLNSPTSFLNAYALEQATSGDTLYLVMGPSPKDTRWQKQKPEKFEALAEHLGDRIRVQVKDQTLAYLKNQPDQRRYDFKLSNGAVAEVVFGKRNQKLWAYLYDPNQIKKFTGFRFYDFNPKAITEGQFKSQKPHFVSYKTVQGDASEVNQVGNVSFSLHGKDFYLPAYNWQTSGEKMDYIALIFTDETKDKETYGGGRELVVELPNGLKDGMKMKLDFNRTLNFYCAHSPFWHCPVGLQKHINTKVMAGEKLPEKKIQ